MKRIKMCKQGFTLLELLVVVLIIGILAGIALPQYNKAVLKARLHVGIPLVESLYMAQQAYALANGNYATDIDALDVEIPKDDSCVKTQNSTTSKYTECKFGTIGLYNDFSNIQFQIPGKIAYLHYLKDYGENNAGDRKCFAKPNSKVAQNVCEDIGGIYISENSSWIRYKLN